MKRHPLPIWSLLPLALALARPPWRWRNPATTPGSGGR